ncbi:DUF429 domain-containing protein [Croceiramulus getboli]|nr:DUF429 domain-containing protein [Flavobacteriaceae bacterium YJPT1-3]
MKSNKKITYGGIDGCKGGWLLVLQVENEHEAHILHTINELEDQVKWQGRFLIDMPIGLTGPSYTRTIEALMRKQLPGRAATVFNAPTRKAIYATNKEEGRRLNIERTGKSISEQSWNISGKIRELDTFLRSTERKDIGLHESHPELCFRYLHGEVVGSRKSTPEGIEQRLQILERFEPNIRESYTRILHQFPRKQVKRDDIVDALCLCIVNQLAGEQGWSRLQENLTLDESGLEVGIFYFDPQRNNSVAK